MAIDALVKPLLNVTLFQGLKPLQITEIARLSDRVVFRPGEAIIREHEMGDSAILIVEGEAVRVRGPELGVPAELVPAGSLIGEMAMLIETEHTSTIVARTPVRALRISREGIREQMLADPALADHFVARITGRLRALSAELQEADRLLGRDFAAHKMHRPFPAPPRSAPIRPTSIHH